MNLNVSENGYVFFPGTLFLNAVNVQDDRKGFKRYMYSPHNVEKYGSQNNTEPSVKKKNYNTESISMALKM